MRAFVRVCVWRWIYCVCSVHARDPATAMHSLDLCPPRGGAGLWRQFTGNEIGVMLAVWLLRHNSWRRDKAERMASVLAGREGRVFGAAAGRRKNKTGGRSNSEKAKAKAMPLAARNSQARKRAGRGRSGRPKKR